ncbi:MAG: hypothetical protein RDV48_19455 [Candidatus Eremiobacteraeota bacterium]|nr:hypothetical protein [Candidatus Eremiobacteraeota bacterium]
MKTIAFCFHLPAAMDKVGAYYQRIGVALEAADEIAVKLLDPGKQPEAVIAEVEKDQFLLYPFEPFRFFSLTDCICRDNEPLSPGSFYPDNISLGFYRALAVALYLRSTSDLKERNFMVTSTGENAPLFPNDTPENCKKNRTVIIQITSLDVAK